MRLDWETAQALVYGGAILGGGGGGSKQQGLEIAELALKLGCPEIVSITDLNPDDWVITVSAVGAPAAKTQFVKPMDFVRSSSILIDAMGCPIRGLIQNEMGGFASANGLIQSAVLGVPLIDAPCNGRAHPLSLMGSLDLYKKSDYRSIQVACGGDPDAGRHIEVTAKGQIAPCSALIRQSSIAAGGIVAVARNPVQASWVRQKGAIGAMDFAITLGKAALGAGQSAAQASSIIARKLGGEIIGRGKVRELILATQGGFDLGTVFFDSGMELFFLNEYLFAEVKGSRLYTFPDLITTFCADTDEVVNTSGLKEGMDIVVIGTSRKNLILGSGMKDIELFRRIERLTKKPITRYVFGGN